MADVLSDVDIAVEQLKRAIRREIPPPEIVTFMGLTGYQIARLRGHYERSTGKRAEDIDTGSEPRE